MAIASAAADWRDGVATSVDGVLDRVFDKFVDAWQQEAGICTYAEAVANCDSALSQTVWVCSAAPAANTNVTLFVIPPHADAEIELTEAPALPQYTSVKITS